MMLRTFNLLLFFLFAFMSSACYAGEKQEIVFTAAAGWEPYVYLDNEGTGQGLYIDLLKLIFEDELGMNLVIEFVPWKRAQHNVKMGNSDLMLTVSTEEREQYAESSEVPLLDFFIHVYTYAGHPKLADMDSISSGEDIRDLGLLPVTNVGNVWHKKNIDSYGVATQYVLEAESSFQMLAVKRADITTEPIVAGNYLINKLHLGDKVVPTDGKFGPVKIYLFMSNKSKHMHLMGHINETLEKMKTNGKLQAIVDKYMLIEKPSKVPILQVVPITSQASVN